MTRKGRRLATIGLALGLGAGAVGLILFALRDNVVFFYGPSELAAKAPGPGTRLRIGGLIEDGSLQKGADRHVSFAITDLKTVVRVTYTGVLPDLFREGQGVVAEGTLTGPGAFAADTVLAKHDEAYMPRDVADALKKQGVWQEGASTPAKTVAR